MPERFIQLGDLHIDGAPSVSDPSFDDCVKAVDEAIASSLDLGPISGWWWPGDLCHKKMTIPSKNALVKMIRTMASYAPVIVGKGNHDADGDLDFLGNQNLNTRWPVYYVTDPRVVSYQLPSGANAHVYVLPYPNKGAIVAAGGDVKETATAAFDVLLMEAERVLEARLAADRLAGILSVKAMLGHVSVMGSVASSGQPQIGRELEVDQATLSLITNCYIGLNHIHKHQACGRAVYAGSMCRLDWGETERKGYIVVDIEPETGAFVWAFRELNVPCRYHIEGPLSLAKGYEWTVRKGPDGPVDEAPESWVGHDVRARVRYQQAEKSMLAMQIQAIKGQFVGARRVEVEPIPISDRQVRAPEVVAETSIDGKLRAYARLLNIEWSDELNACVERLIATDEDALSTLPSTVATELRELLDMEQR